MPDITQITTAIVTAIVSIVGTIIAFWSKNKEIDNTGNATVIKALMDQCNMMRLALKESDEKNTKLENDLVIIRRELEEVKKILQIYEFNPINKDAKVILEVLVNQFDFPVWVCEVETGNWYINDAFSKIFNVPRKNFWTPIKIFELFEATNAAEHQEANMRAIRFNSPLLSQEQFLENMMDKESDFNKESNWYVLRVPVLSSNKFLIIFSSKDVQDCIFKKYA